MGRILMDTYRLIHKTDIYPTFTKVRRTSHNRVQNIHHTNTVEMIQLAFTANYMWLLILVLVCIAQSGLAPNYVLDFLKSYEPPTPLWSWRTLDFLLNRGSIKYLFFPLLLLNKKYLNRWNSWGTIRLHVAREKISFLNQCSKYDRAMGTSALLKETGSEI